MTTESELSAKVSAILGERVTVSTEYGVGVFSLESCQLLLSTGKAPKNLTADWIARAIERKAATAASVKARREVAVNLMRDGLKARGLNPDGMNLYYTSTGFSVCNLFRNGLEEAKRIISECGINAKRLEYSEAHWVVRVIL